ncbi:endonuclease/exonuclease/phosphatase family protein [Asaia astilbis]|uniref:endonuclease/exonuclease/phosphatase family protein n=1 Tax=Asaia astilbis TaxID=610244 RepID=UPI000A040446|nr:endonuclease/exonuclease/phosphatase family protein [Asaia astilbis]
MFSAILALRSDRLCLLLLAVWGLSRTAEAASLKIATWNLDWLTQLPASAPGLPVNIPHRSAPDWSALRKTAYRLDADIVAVQEVSDEAALRRLFPSPDTKLVMSKAPIVQNLGVALRAPWHVVTHEELPEFDRSPYRGGHPLRPGLDLTVSNGKHVLHLLIVHLKSGCWFRRWSEKGYSCPILRDQIDLISNWIAEREDEGDAYVVLGDFNRRFTLRDPYFMRMIDGTAPVLTTAGYASPCEDGNYFIDHLLIGGAARDWLVKDSLRVLVYPPEDASFTLSDHCPVSVRLLLP